MFNVVTWDVVGRRLAWEGWGEWDVLIRSRARRATGACWDGWVDTGAAIRACPTFVFVGNGCIVYILSSHIHLLVTPSRGLSVAILVLLFGLRVVNLKRFYNWLS